MEHASDTLRQDLFGIGIATAVVAWTASPLLRFISPNIIMLAGFLAATAALLVWEGEKTRGWPVRVTAGVKLAGYVLGFMALGFAISGLFRAGLASTVNDRRCAAIQADMLSARPRKPDGAALFQAFGCRPQGLDPRLFVAPTEGERRAGHPLPFGGYPPPR